MYIRHISSRTTNLISFIALLIFLPLFLLVIQQTVTLLSRATGKPAAITVNVTIQLEPIKTDFYHAFAQGGEESTDMLAPLMSDIRALNPKYIRIDHIYDHYGVVSRDGSGLRFDWTKLDSVITTILSTGATPVLSLSYMPSAIAKDGSIINPPNDWNEWAAVVQATIEHFSGKPNRNLRGVYYEVWNEPDLEQFGKWGLSGEKNYLTLYRYAAIGANAAAAVNPFYLGGPATTGMYTRWITSLVESKLRLDFFSWHSYLPDPERFAQDQRNVIKALLPYPTYTLKPKLITEFGFTGAKSAAYGTSYAAAHTAAVVRQLQSGGPTYLFTFELKDGPNENENAGWGLIAHESQGMRKKPRYYVYSFLDQMAGKRLLLTGEGSWVTGYASTQNNVIRVLLVNFDQRGSHSETVPVTLTGIRPGTYSIKQTFLLGKTTTSTVSTDTSSLAFTVIMSPQSVVIHEITAVAL